MPQISEKGSLILLLQKRNELVELVVGSVEPLVDTEDGKREDNPYDREDEQNQSVGDKHPFHSFFGLVYGCIFA